MWPIFSNSAEFGDSSEISMNDIQRNLQKLYEYNVMLREKLQASLSRDRVPVEKGSSSNSIVQWHSL